MSQRGITLTIVLCLSIFMLSAGGAVAQTVAVQGSPDLTPYTTTDEVSPGTAVELTVQVGNSGTLRRGDAAQREFVTTARGVSAKLSSGDAPVDIKSGSQLIGTLSESEPAEVTFDVEIPKDAEAGTYTLPVELDYKYDSRINNDPSGGTIATFSERSRTETESITLRISDEAQFEVNQIADRLRVGEEGKITGELKNVGNNDARNAEVSFAPESETVIALESSVAVGDVPAGESTQFSIPVEVTSDAEAVPKRFDLPVDFRDENGIRQSDDDPSFRVNVAEQRDAFLIEPADNAIEAGATDTLDIELTNNLDEPVTDIEGKLFADDPLSSENDETYTETLDPGETKTVTVDLSAGGDATVKTYPVSMDFRYTDSNGDSKLSDSYRTAISVTEPTDDGGGLPIGPLLLVLLVVAGGGAFLWRRNDGELDDIGGLRDE